MENPIQEWINSDDKIYNLIIDIQKSTSSPLHQAEKAFDKICSIYDIPKMPENTNNTYENRSLFEEHALINFLAPENEDPRGLVLSAAYNILNNKLIDYFEIAKKEYNQEIPNPCQVGVSGDGYNSKVVFFEKETLNWEDLGCQTITSIHKS
ncbi:hypothetical protein OAX11_03395 [Flavobacteriaceae bacterium]|jgi:hypothetical protein|nr:hypothetical protein [Flavobacteriaceae bacterium]